jgi:hypothetical protein
MYRNRIWHIIVNYKSLNYLFVFPIVRVSLCAMAAAATLCVRLGAGSTQMECDTEKKTFRFT